MAPTDTTKCLHVSFLHCLPTEVRPLPDPGRQTFCRRVLWSLSCVGKQVTDYLPVTGRKIRPWDASRPAAEGRTEGTDRCPGPSAPAQAPALPWKAGHLPDQGNQAGHAGRTESLPLMTQPKEEP